MQFRKYAWYFACEFAFMYCICAEMTKQKYTNNIYLQNTLNKQYCMHKYNRNYYDKSDIPSNLIINHYFILENYKIEIQEIISTVNKNTI